VPDLYPHQVRAVEEVLPRLPGGWMLLPEQRTGKSRIALELARRLGARRILVLCPSQHGNVPRVWVDEAKAHWPELRVTNLVGTGAQRAQQAARLAAEPGLVICNYEAEWRRPLHQTLLAQHWDVLIADEVHRCKAHRGAQQRAVAELARRIPTRLGLTGTPMHSPLDVWGQFNIVDPSIFGPSFVRMRLRYTRPAQRSEWRDPDVTYTKGRGGTLERWKYRDLDDLQARMYSRATRILLRDAFPGHIGTEPLPDEVRTVTLEPAARKAYRELERELVTEIKEGTITAANGGVRVLRLQQLCGGTLTATDEVSGTKTAVRISTAKEDLLREMLIDFGDEPIVVFGRFHSDLDAIHRACKAAGATSGELSGRRSDLAAWQQGEQQVLVAQVQAGGVGISLVRAATVLWYSLGASLIDWTQARSRTLGPLQTRPVTNYVLLVEDTARSGDEAVYAALKANQNVVNAVVERGPPASG